MYEISPKVLARFYFYFLLSSRQLSKQRVYREALLAALISKNR